MKKDHSDEAFIEKCRNIDFSNESMNQEKNLTQLKSKINCINLEREAMMNRKMRKPLVFATAASMLLCFFIIAYGRDLIRVVKTIKLGDYAEFQVMGGGADDTIYLPEEVEKVMEKLSKDGFYEKDGFMLSRVASTDNFEFVKFRDVKEGQSYFICDTLMPTYLPDGYEFDRIEFMAKSVEEFTNSQGGERKYMSVFYSNGENEIYSQVRYMDEETTFGSSGYNDVNTFTINGHNAVLAENSLNILIGNVMYYFRANDQLRVDELIKISESLQ